jgi:hypothetical protein
MTLFHLPLVLIIPHKFFLRHFVITRWLEFLKYDFRIVPNGTTSIPNFILIRPLVLDLNHADRRTDRHRDMTSPMCVPFMHFVQRTHKTPKYDVKYHAF